MSGFGVFLGIVGTALVAFIVLTIYILNPIEFITVPLSELYAAPDHQPMYPLAVGWSVLALAAIWSAAVLERRWTTRQDVPALKRNALRTSGALALLGGVCVSSFIPGMPIGLGFIIDAENGGYFTGDGGGLLSAVWAIGVAAFALGLLGFFIVRLANDRQDADETLGARRL